MGAILNHLIKDHGATMQEAKFALAKWDIRPIESNGVEVGQIMLQQNEIHVALEPSFRKQVGRHNLLKNTIDSLLDEKGFLVTKLDKKSAYKKQIMRMGFVQTREDAEYEYFWLNKKDD